MLETKIIGYQEKAEFHGDINGKHIDSPAKLVLYTTSSNLPDESIHGQVAGSTTVTREFASRINNGSEDFNRLIGCKCRFDYQFVNGKSILCDIVIINDDGTEFKRKEK
ncbi:MAG: hypothetical protein IJ555_08055 [Ruminococcus sp.]|nr:hypothetical protein [Ruminococcus sp.]MBR1739057.1 hypothetical protein [Ruminococcus sp.]